MEKVSEYIRGKGLKYKALWKNCNYQSIAKQIFKVKHSDVDINAAIDVGFGVLELHKGKYAGQKFMFDLRQDHHCYRTDSDAELQLKLQRFYDLLGVGVERLSSEERFNRFNNRLGMYLKAISTNEVQQWSFR